jgi:molybdenum cofactor synthesis domain-containing protein
MIRIAVITVSDTRSKESDLTGRIIQDIFKGRGFQVYGYDIIQDDKRKVKSRLLYYADKVGVDLIITSGGTGLGPRDVTPEATLAIIEKEAPGIVEFMRAQGVKRTERAVLSRAVAGVRGRSLIVNLPGSPRGAKESLESILGVIPHAIDMIKGAGHK